MVEVPTETCDQATPPVIVYHRGHTLYGYDLPNRDQPYFIDLYTAPHISYDRYKMYKVAASPDLGICPEM